MKSSLPKVLHPLAGMPLVGHVLATARALDAAHVVAVVRHERDRVAEVDHRAAAREHHRRPGRDPRHRPRRRAGRRRPARRLRRRRARRQRRRAAARRRHARRARRRAPRRARHRATLLLAPSSTTRPATAASSAATPARFDRIVEQKDATPERARRRARSTPASTSSPLAALRDQLGEARPPTTPRARST